MSEFDYIISKICENLGFGTTRTGETKLTNCALIFAFNGTGKTRLSDAFAHSNIVDGRSLYYNAFTEDLFTWHNDLDNDNERYIVINTNSALIRGLDGYDYAKGINDILMSFANFNAHFENNYHDNDGKLVITGDNIPREVWFSRTMRKVLKNRDGSPKLDQDGNQIYKYYPKDYIKISRGEERLFVWSVFRYIMNLVIKKDDNFKDIKYIYVDDPMSSLDDNNVILFADQLCSTINGCYDTVWNKYKSTNIQDELDLPKFIISTHHTVFFNTMSNGLKGYCGLSLYKDHSQANEQGVFCNFFSGHTPAFYHISMLAQIRKELDSITDGQPPRLQRYHFNVMRGIVEQFAQVLGQSNRENGPLGKVLDGIVYHRKDEVFTAEDNDQTGFEHIHANALNILSHFGNTMFESAILNDDNIQIMRDIYNHLVNKYGIVVPQYYKKKEKNNNQTKEQ